MVCWGVKQNDVWIAFLNWIVCVFWWCLIYYRYFPEAFKFGFLGVIALSVCLTVQDTPGTFWSVEITKLEPETLSQAQQILSHAFTEVSQALSIAIDVILATGDCIGWGILERNIWWRQYTKDFAAIQRNVNKECHILFLVCQNTHWLFQRWFWHNLNDTSAVGLRKKG